MSILSIILLLLQAVICIGLTSIILLQSDRASGFTASLSGSGSSGDTYWGKNKGRSMEGALEKYTKIGATMFIVMAIVVNIVLQMNI